VGQEITARMRYRALLKKKIYSLEIKEGSPLIGQLIKDNENEFGKIISIKNDSVLAMLKIELAEIKINTKKKIKTNEGLVLEFIL
jgi:folate-binding Fe-S cluster repair protein YgfZ